MVTGLGVHNEHLATSFDIQVRKFVGFLDHEMRLERAVGSVSNRGNHVGTKGQVWDETAIHHVELEPINTSLVQGNNFVAEAAEVGW